MVAALRDAAWHLMQQGGNPFEIDRALAGFGLRGGVFRGMDITGYDTGLKRLKLLHNGAAYPHAHQELLERMVAAGRLGRRAKLGFYVWDETGVTRSDPEIADIFPEVQWGRRAAPSDQIVTHCIAAMANQGARLLRSDAAVRPSDIDAVMILALGFPRHQGGPMHAADQIGLFKILQTLKRTIEVDAGLYTPDPGIATLVKNGENFSVLNRIGRLRRKIPA